MKPKVKLWHFCPVAGEDRWRGAGILHLGSLHLSTSLQIRAEGMLLLGHRMGMVGVIKLGDSDDIGIFLFFLTIHSSDSNPPKNLSH